MLSIQSLLPWGAYTIVLLYLWLAFAYALAARRSGQRRWWITGVAWLNWLVIIWLDHSFDRDQFQLFPLLMSSLVLLVPLVVVALHLLGKARFTEYSHPRDVLLFRQPHASPTQSQVAVWETLSISVLAMTLVLVSAASLSLRPCHWLDRTLHSSGCDQVLLYDGLLQDLTFSPDGSQLAIASEKGVRLWNTTDGQLLALIPYPSGAKSVAFSPDGRLLASGGRDQHIQIRQTDGTLIQQLQTTDQAESIAFSPDGRLLGAGIGTSVVVWRLEDGARLWALPTSDEVYSVVFSPDGALLAAGSYGGAITIRRSADGAPIQTMADSTVYQLAFSPDGTMLAGGTFGDRLDVWRMNDGKRLWSFTGSASQELMWSVAFSPSGAYLLGGSGNHSLRIWRANDFALLRTLTFDDQVHNVAVHPNGLTVAIGLWDETIRLWSIR